MTLRLVFFICTVIVFKALQGIFCSLKMVCNFTFVLKNEVLTTSLVKENFLALLAVAVGDSKWSGLDH